MIGLEREFPLWVLEEQVGRVFLDWDDLWLTVRAELRRGEGLYKLWLQGDGGGLLLGTPAPEGRWLTLCRRISIAQARRAGVWPPTGAAALLTFPYDPKRPFPLTAVFCFARVEGGQGSLRFDESGWPVMPAGEARTIPRK